MAPGYIFRAMTATDLPLIRSWLQTPEVVRWRGDPDEQHALVSSDLDHPDMDQFIVSLVVSPQSERIVDTPDGPALLTVRNP